MKRRGGRAAVRPATLTLAGTLVLAAATLAFSGSSGAAVSAVTGSAYGYQLKVSLFGSPVNTRGFGQEACTAPNVPVGCAGTPANPASNSDAPSVALQGDGSNSPLTATEPSVTASVGPATFLVTGTQTVETAGTIGATGSVTTTATISGITTDLGGALAATTLSSACSTSAVGVATGSTAIVDGLLRTDGGDDSNGDGDFTDPGEHAPVTVTLPAAPAVNTSFQGHIHVTGIQQDFVYLFNEQVIEVGALTVFAAHQRLGVTSINPDVADPDAIAVGDLFIGKVTCGLTGLPDAVVTTTTLPGQTTTSTTTAGSTTTSSTTLGSSTSSTTPGSSTSSTAPGSSTSSTVRGSSTGSVETTSTTRAPNGSGGSLPRTGTGASVLALLGLVLLTAGAVTKVLGKKHGSCSGPG